MADTIDNKLKQPNPQQQKNTGFTNIQDVVRANRQNRLGQTVSGGISGVVNKDQQDLSKSFDQFHQGAQQNAIGTAADQAYVNQTIQNPDASKENIDRFAKLRSGQYQGPTGLANQEQLQAQGQDLQSLGNAATNEYGRRGLLQRFVAPNQYTQGQQRLDNLLLGQTGGQALNQARRQANLFGQQLGQTNQAANAEAQGLTQQAQQFGQNVTNQLGQAQTTQQQDLENRVKEQQMQSEAARKALSMLLSKPQAAADTSKGGYSTMPVHPTSGDATGITPTSGGNLTPEEFEAAKKALSSSGLLEQQFYNPQFFTQKPEDIIGQQVNAPTIQQAATEQDKARSIALSQLAGQQPTLFQQDTKVGGYDPLGFLDKNRLNEAIGSSKKSYDQYEAANKAQDLIKNLLPKYQEDQSNYNKAYNQIYKAGAPVDNTNPWVKGLQGQLENKVDDPEFQNFVRGRMGEENQTVQQANDLLKNAGIEQQYKSLANSTSPGLMGSDINTYLRAMQGTNPELFAPSLVNSNTGVNNAMADLAKQQAELGAGGPKLSLLEKLKSLTGNNNAG